MEKNNIVNFDPKDDTRKGFSFVSTIDEESIERTIDDILRVIKVNKEREIKDQLFKETVEKLKQTFEKTDLDKLEKLNFYFDEETIISDDIINEPEVKETKDEQPKKPRKSSKVVEPSEQ
jgi:hypothetical protein